MLPAYSFTTPLKRTVSNFQIFETEFSIQLPHTFLIYIFKVIVYQFFVYYCKKSNIILQLIFYRKIYIMNLDNILYYI